MYIRQDGFRRLYQQETGSEQAPNEQQLVAWLEEAGHEDLDYSALLSEIAPDPAIRRELLAGYFKGAQPGPAHEHLADLAAAGVARVFITTNFDRLLETALIARRIEPVIVSDDATLKNNPRREHADVFIVKAHGDYTQETIRNTPSELEELSPVLTGELRAIVDHYGLVVVGWKGSDPALAEIVRQRTPSRYGVWWLSRAYPPGQPGGTLIEQIGARLIVRPGGAGEFLGELDRRVSLYRAHESGNDPGTVHDEVLGLLKRRGDIDLDELLRRERFEFESVIQSTRTELANADPQDIEKLSAGWDRLAAATDRRLASLIPLALHSPDRLEVAISQHAEWVTALTPMNSSTIFIEAWILPAWIIGMALGGLAVTLDHFEALRPLLTTVWRDPNDYPSPFVGTGKMGEWVGGQHGPDPPPRRNFLAWGWLPRELKSKEWLASRHPDWLRRDGEPERLFIKFSLLLNIATSLPGSHRMMACWSYDEPASEQFAKRLHDNPTLRERAATAVGLTLAEFNEKAPTILRGMAGMSGFPSIGRTANMLEHGSYSAPPEPEREVGL